MCGITGIVDLKGGKVERSTIAHFNDSLSHRGPDSSGVSLHDGGSIALGHRRLAIIDLSHQGAQPMTTQDGRYTITYNGEIFNFESIRSELKGYGYDFRSLSDTEVILNAYRHWGEDCLSRFNGMWAFGIWDEENKELFLSRDRFGIKPMYFLHKPGELFAFASETLAFKSLDGFNRRLDQTLFDIGFKDPLFLEGQGLTCFENIVSLMPGHHMMIRDRQVMPQRRWWLLDDHIQKVPKSFTERREQFHNLFMDSCRVRLISDVPIATALSGGLDSSSVYAAVKELSDQEGQKRGEGDLSMAFNVSFPGMENDERQYAERLVSQKNGTLRVVEHDQSQLIDNLVNNQLLLDAYSPAPITAISQVYQSMRQSGITVSMDGHGVDEMLFGYRGMISELYYRSLGSGDMKGLDYFGNVLVQMHHPCRREALKQKLRTDARLVKKKGWIIRLKGLLGRPPIETIEQMMNERKRALGEPLFGLISSLPPMDIATREFTYRTLPTVLRNFDRASMMNGVEVRMPFLDYRLVSFVFSLGIEDKVNQGYTKHILRESQIGSLPEDIRLRTYKVGVGNPLSNWLEIGVVKEGLLDFLTESQRKEVLLIGKRPESLTLSHLMLWKYFSQRMIS